MSDMHTVNIEADEVINRLSAQIAKLSADLAVAQASADAWSKRALAAEAMVPKDNETKVEG